jgi:GT2 family glycosyltransferase
VSERPLVSIVIPSIGSRGVVFGVERCFVVEAVRSVLATASVTIDLEVIVVAGRAMPSAVADTLVSLTIPPPSGSSVAIRTVRIVEYDATFNFSAAVNLGASHAAGKHLLLLNDDVEVISPDWLAKMLDALDGDGGAIDAVGAVGAVGAKLLFEDGTLQHAGHTYRTSLDHVGFGLPGDAAGRHGILTARRPVAGVTAACMLVPFDVYDMVGGLCVELPMNYNDVDLSMKIRAAGLSIVYEPAAVLHHFESRSRVAGIRTDEIEFIQSRWLHHLLDDPFTPAVV